MSIRFTWDREKARLNVHKHQGISFEEATTVFRDPLAAVFDDDAHSQDERRELIIGHSNRNRLLIVSFTEQDDLVRIISARKADAEERAKYEHTRR
jgi:uncharacterized DUF497 family protein